MDKIPQDVRQKIWVYYLQGKSFGLIRRLTGVSKSAVFNIATGIEKEDPDYPMMRALSVEFRKAGIDKHEYATSIHISSKFREYGIDQAVADELVEKILVALYQAQWPPSEALEAFKEFSESAKIFGKTPREHSLYFNKLFRKRNELEEQIRIRQKELHKTIYQNKVVTDNLEEFLEPEGVFKSSGRNLLEIMELKQENKDLKTDLDLHRQGKSIDPVQVDNLNNCLIIPISEKEVLDKLEDVRRHPAEYSTLFEKHLPKSLERDPYSPDHSGPDTSDNILEGIESADSLD